MKLTRAGFPLQFIPDLEISEYNDYLSAADIILCKDRIMDYELSRYLAHDKRVRNIDSVIKNYQNAINKILFSEESEKAISDDHLKLAEKIWTEQEARLKLVRENKSKNGGKRKTISHPTQIR